MTSDEEDVHRESLRTARAMLEDDEEAPRTFMLSTVFENGNDYTFGTTGDEQVQDTFNALATLLLVVSRAVDRDPAEVAEIALAVARSQDEIGGGEGSA